VRQRPAEAHVQEQGRRNLVRSLLDLAEPEQDGAENHVPALGSGPLLLQHGSIRVLQHIVERDMRIAAQERSYSRVRVVRHQDAHPVDLRTPQHEFVEGSHADLLPSIPVLEFVRTQAHILIRPEGMVGERIEIPLEVRLLQDVAWKGAEAGLGA
jgi:hypothetical protein